MSVRAKINTHYRRILIAATCVMAGIDGACAAPHDGLPAGDIAAHHVRLTGDGFAKTHTSVFDYVAEVCRAMGKTPELPPPGEPIHQVSEDVYYTIGGVTSYTRKKTYSLHPQTCTLQTNEHLEVKMRTASGVCTITPKRKRAVGDCGTQPLIAGKNGRAQETQPSNPSGPAPSPE